MKKLLSIILAIATIASAMLCLAVPSSAESLYIRKIVSVVYDDSGSMSGDKYAYANYAMQTFCGMLNSEDQLFVTYMSHHLKDPDNYKPEKIDLSASGIGDSVNSIRKHKGSGMTPYGAVETAFKKLSSVNDSNPNTQYWLVVITDGVFDECTTKNDDEKKRFLNENLGEYTKKQMPNGTMPQVTFLGIGDVVSPDEDRSKGIYTYSASNAAGIIGAMSDMADRISGRTRLQKSDVKKTDENTVQVSSSIPLLNIAVFAQGSEAKAEKAVYSNERNIPIARSVSLSYPGYNDLVGGAYLLGDSQSAIGSGTYNITFDREIDLDEVIILFEPALEIRVTLSANGTVISDYKELDNLMEGDEISASCKICEMGTDNEIDPSLLPPGTQFAINVYEDGKLVAQADGKDMTLPDHVLKNTDTEIVAAVTIEGFNPIDYSAKFKPTKYVPKTVYSIEADYGSRATSIKFDDIGANKDLTVCFTVYADGVAMTDPNAVKVLNPKISVSPSGNDGDVSYSKDGRIVFTPNTASKTSSDVESFDVSVKCALEDGTSADLSYKVLISTYMVIPIDTDQTIKKTELFDNQTSASFYITKDGVRLDGSAVGKEFSVLLNEEYAALKTHVSVGADGSITVTPYSEEQHTLTFWNWWTNWLYYFKLEGNDVVVVLDHVYGSANNTINVVGEGLIYQLLNVYLPLAIELAVLAFLIWWVYAICAKPKFAHGARLYRFDLAYFASHDGGSYHELTLPTGSPYRDLSMYNKLKYRWKPTLKTEKVSVGDLSISAAYGGGIVCHYRSSRAICYEDEVTPQIAVAGPVEMDPKSVYEFIRDNEFLRIVEISPQIVTFKVGGNEKKIKHSGSKYYLYSKEPVHVPGHGFVVESGTLFAYVIK